MGKPYQRMALRQASLISGLVWALVLAGWAPTGFSLPSGRQFDAGVLPPGSCGNVTEIKLPSGAVMCTHGADPAPDGVDPGIPWTPWTPSTGAHPQGLLFPDPPGGPPARAAAERGIACYGDGTSGNRVQAVYAYPADRPDRFNDVVGSIRQWAADTDGVFQDSAAKTGGTRRIRFVTDASCNLVVQKVRLAARGDDTFDNTLAEFQAQGLSRADRKYLVWMDSTALCGIGTYYVDDRPGPSNANDGPTGIPGAVARIDSGCWGLGSRGQSVEAHELMHTLGTVQPTAPHGSPAGHCRDDSDRMCYEDGTVISLLSHCPNSEEALFDCDNDDYFSTSPRPGSYLATHWNAANSRFLSSSLSTPTISIADASAEEGDAGTKALSFTVSLSTAASQGVTLNYATANGSAAAGSDYDAAKGMVSFQVGETTKTIPVALRGDSSPEDDESFVVKLSSPVNAPLDRSQATGTIVDDEPGRQGYWFVASDGGIFAYGGSKFQGSTGDIRLNQPVVGMARTPSGQGYWLVARDGGIFSFGDARFFGSTGSLRLNQPIVGMAATPTGAGYWFVAADGGIFSFGDAQFFGSTGTTKLNAPIVGMAATPTGGGYWFVAADGAVFSFGDARHFGNQGAVTGPVAGMAATRSAGGYWLAGQDGAVYAFGDAAQLGSTPRLNRRVVGMAGTPTGNGHWLVGEDGGIFAFGDAKFLGSTGDIRLNQPIVGMAAAPGR